MTYDLAEYLLGNGTPVGISHRPGADGIYQAQRFGRRVLQLKGHVNADCAFEELWYDAEYIWRGLDTSPADGVPYTLRDTLSERGSKWARRRMAVGDVFERNPYVVHVKKSDGAVVRQSGPARSWLTLVEHHDQWHAAREVLELWWLTGSPRNGKVEEKYFYGRGLGLVGFEGPDLRAFANYVWPDKPPAPGIPVLRREALKWWYPETLEDTPAPPVVTPPPPEPEPEPEPPPPDVPTPPEPGLYTPLTSDELRQLAQLHTQIAAIFYAAWERLYAP